MRKHLCFLVSVKDAFLKGLICMGRQGLPHLDTDLAADLKKKGGGKCRNASRFTESQTPTVTLL